MKKNVPVRPEKTKEELDILFMRDALRQARKAFMLGEVPIGCVIVHEGKVIARGYNRRNTDHTALAHAEIRAIKKASRVIGDWRLEECTLYCTLEPCPMCAGAIEQARLERVVIGTASDKSGCAGTVMNLLQNPAFNHQCVVDWDVCGDECREILQLFFRDLRVRNRREKEEKRAAADEAAPV